MIKSSTGIDALLSGRSPSYSLINLLITDPTRMISRSGLILTCSDIPIGMLLLLLSLSVIVFSCFSFGIKRPQLFE